METTGPTSMRRPLSEVKKKALLATRAYSPGPSLLQLAHVLHRALVEAIFLDDLPVVQRLFLQLVPTLRGPHFFNLPMCFTVPWSRPYFLMTFLSCNMSNSSVASFPANKRIAFAPPGCSARKFVTS